MRILGTTALALVALTTVAFAAGDPEADLYSNTLVVTSPDNVVTKILVQKDGTWTSTASDGTSTHGQWARLGKFSCVSDAAMAKAKPNCFKTVERHVGDKWTAPGAKKGIVDQLTITAGR